MTHPTVEVCTDCYFAHHLGMHEHDGKWFAGGSDSAADCKPLGLVEGLDLADAVDPETSEGYDTFSWSQCDGCGSTLGGARYSLADLTPV